MKKDKLPLIIRTHHAFYEKKAEGHILGEKTLKSIQVPSFAIKENFKDYRLESSSNDESFNETNYQQEEDPSENIKRFIPPPHPLPPEETKFSKEPLRTGVNNYLMYVLNDHSSVENWINFPLQRSQNQKLNTQDNQMPEILQKVKRIKKIQYFL